MKSCACRVDEHLDAAHSQPNRHALDWNSHAGPGQDFRSDPATIEQKAEEIEKVLHQVRAR
jgi:hypothetical protein